MTDGPLAGGCAMFARQGACLPSAVETRPVELADAKAGVSLDAGHRVVLVVNGATGSKRYRAQAAPATLEPGAPGGVKDDFV